MKRTIRNNEKADFSFAISVGVATFASIVGFAYIYKKINNNLDRKIDNRIYRVEEEDYYDCDYDYDLDCSL